MLQNRNCRIGMGGNALPNSKRKSKYGNHVVYENGMKFDSEKELERWHELQLMQRAGMIHSLKRQIPFELIPAVRETIYTKTGKAKEGKVIHRAVNYVADFTYYDKSNNYVVEDVKGFKTETYKLKAAIMRYYKGIIIKEV